MVHFYDVGAREIGMSRSSDEDICFNNEMVTKLCNELESKIWIAIKTGMEKWNVQSR